MRKNKTFSWHILLISAYILFNCFLLINTLSSKASTMEGKLYGSQYTEDELLHQDFAEFQEAITHDYDDFATRNNYAYENFRNIIDTKWAVFKDSTKTAWVNYSDDYATRSTVDFKNGLATFEVLIDSDSDEAKQEAQERLKAQLHAIDKSCQKEAGFGLKSGESYDITVELLPNKKDEAQNSEDAAEFKSILETPVAPENLDDTEGLVVTDITDAEDVTEPEPVTPQPKNLTPQVAPEQSAQSIPLTQPKQIITATVKLPSDYLQKAAKKYRGLVYSNAKRFDIDTNVIYAIIHTESYFDPFARSPIPAFGLMQLVPNSGGKDAYEYVYKKKAKPSEKYLYNPQNNILLGTAYMNKIINVYFKGVHDKETAYILSIAAYNTGIGNVSKAITGRKSLDGVPEIVNNMTSAEVCALLLEKLPYDETKQYLERVLQRSSMYHGI